MGHEHGATESAASYSLDSEESVTEGIIAAVSEYLDADPVPGEGTRETLEPLYHAIDPDALEALFDGSRNESGESVEIGFRYMGYAITVSTAGRIEIGHLDPA